MRRGLSLIAAAASMSAAPSLAHACSVCSVLGNAATRDAFIGTTIVLSLLPLALIFGAVLWFKHKAKSAFADEFRESDEEAPVADQQG